MPYKSKKQEAFFHTDTAKKKGISSKVVNEFDKASKGKDLPERSPGSKKKEPIKSLDQLRAVAHNKLRQK